MSDTLSRAQKLFDLGAHLGHRKSRLHPKSRPFVFAIIDGVSVINLESTVAQIDTAAHALAQAGRESQSLLIVATKKSVSQAVQTLAKDAHAHFITTKWLPGLLTNFDTIAKNTKKLVELRRQKEAGEWGKFVKHEQVALEKEMRKLERLYSGVVGMQRIPDLLFVVDIKREKNAVTEATKFKLPVVAIVDTNCDPNEVKYPVLLNDDVPAAVMSVFEELIASFKKTFDASAAQKELAQAKTAAPVTPVKVEEKPVVVEEKKPAKAVKKELAPDEATPEEVERVTVKRDPASQKKAVTIKKPAKKEPVRRGRKK